MWGWDQRQRLLRENWTAPALAEEIFAMMSPDVPANTNGPVSITPSTESTVAPISLGNFDEGAGPIFNFKNKDGSNGGDIGFSGGQFVFTDANGKQSTIGGSGGGGSVPVWG